MRLSSFYLRGVVQFRCHSSTSLIDCVIRPTDSLDSSKAGVVECFPFSPDRLTQSQMKAAGLAPLKKLSQINRAGHVIIAV